MPDKHVGRIGEQHHEDESHHDLVAEVDPMNRSEGIEFHAIGNHWPVEDKEKQDDE